MDDILAGELALVTGAGQGNGEAIAVGLAAHGAAVVATDIDSATAARTAARIRDRGGEAWAFELDVADLDACRRLAARLGAEIGLVSVLVNNAGIEPRGQVTDDDAMDAWRATMAVNLDGVYHATHAFLDALIARRGRVVNIASIHAYVSTIDALAYTVSKGGVRLLTIQLARELGPHGVRVNALAPGMIATPLTAATRADPERLGKFLARVPLGRYAEPEELVGPVVFLASPLSSYVTGAVLPVDGGFLTM